ncbi:proton channel OTOP1-like [Protopterus annectens]|uniref:proton channel OTOP1-like n=1 Tax=Protopterus annectens TaxID=7888 RepID=UPI001CFA7B86|nr:proton channel OTOP1-like [Protopterus annectens]
MLLSPQVSFLSFNAKVCIQDQPNINRFGLMHTIATNILVWMSTVLDESAEQLKELYHVNKTVGQAILQDSQYTNSCECFTKACYVFREGSIYLYPFNIEFSLFSSVMLYIMWKNVERVPHVDEFVKTKRRAVSFNGILIGLVFGVLVLLSTFGVMILSGVHAKKSEILPYYSFDSGLLFTMFVASVTGIATNQHRKNDSASKRPKSVVRNVDISLLLGSSCGPLMGSVFSLVSFFFCQVRDYFNFLDFCLSVCRIVQLLAQNLFIAEALYSVPNGLESEEKESLVFSISQSAHSFVFHHGVCNEGFDDTTENFSCLAKEQNSDISTSQEFKTLSSLHKPDCSFIPRISQTDDIFQLREIKESRVLKKNLIPNISVFLIFCNISVWILCAYLIRPHLHSQIEQKFYGSTLWAIIENISLPLGIFYHMHSVASLFEVYCRS